MPTKDWAGDCPRVDVAFRLRNIKTVVTLPPAAPTKMKASPTTAAIEVAWLCLFSSSIVAAAVVGAVGAAVGAADLAAVGAANLVAACWRKSRGKGMCSSGG